MNDDERRGIFQNYFYELAHTAFGTMGIVWWETAAGPRVRKTILDTGMKAVEEVIKQDFPHTTRFSCSAIAELRDRIRRFLDGNAVVFDLEITALELCGQFQREVLLAEYGIPRGW